MENRFQHLHVLWPKLCCIGSWWIRLRRPRGGAWNHYQEQIGRAGDARSNGCITVRLLQSFRYTTVSCCIPRYASRLPFINADKIAVTGVSYGGYIATLMLSERHNDILACGVAVSPVVDWRFYGKWYSSLTDKKPNFYGLQNRRMPKDTWVFLCQVKTFVAIRNPA